MDRSIPIAEGRDTIVPEDSHAELTERFRKLLEADGPALARLAGSYTNNRRDRDDLFQDIALAIWQALPRFRGESSERTFLFRIAHNRGVGHLTRRRPQMAEYDETEVPDPTPDQESKLSEEGQRQRLLEAIQRLPVSQRQVITLTLEGMSYAEIAAILGITEGNVGVRLNRARARLRELLEVRK